MHRGDVVAFAQFGHPIYLRAARADALPNSTPAFSRALPDVSRQYALTLEATPTMPRRSDDLLIERARLLYVDTDLSLKEIAVRIGVHKATLSRWVVKNGWPPRTSSIVRKTLPDAGDANLSVDAQSTAAPRTLNKSTGKKKPARPKFSALVDRLYRIIIHNLELMENRMSDDNESAGGNPERDVRAIGNIVRSVEKLKEIEPEQSKRDAPSAGGTRYPLSADEEDRLRIEIVERLLKLRERRGNPDSGR